MSEYPEHLSEKLSEPLKMSAVLEAQSLVRVIAEPRAVGDSVKASINKAARRLGFSFSRAKDIWYGDARRIDAAEIDRLREIAGRHEARLAVARMVEVRRYLAQTDPDSYGDTIAALDGTLNRIGGSVRAMDVREG